MSPAPTPESRMPLLQAESVPEWLRRFASRTAENAEMSAEVASDHAELTKRTEEFVREATRIIEYEDLSAPGALSKATTWFTQSSESFFDVPAVLTRLFERYRVAQWSPPSGSASQLILMASKFAPNLFRRAVLEAADETGLILGDEKRREKVGASPSDICKASGTYGAASRFITNTAAAGDTECLGAMLDALLSHTTHLTAGRCQTGLGNLIGEGFAKADFAAKSRINAAIDRAFGRANDAELTGLVKFDVALLTHVLDFHGTAPELFDRLMRHDHDRAAGAAALKHFPEQAAAAFMERAAGAPERAVRVNAIRMLAEIPSDRSFDALKRAAEVPDPATRARALHTLAGTAYLPLSSHWLSGQIVDALASSGSDLLPVAALVDRYGSQDSLCNEVWDSAFRSRPMTRASVQRIALACRTSLGYFEPNRWSPEVGLQRFVTAIGFDRIVGWIHQEDPALRDSAHTLLETLRKPAQSEFLAGEIKKFLGAA